MMNYKVELMTLGKTQMDLMRAINSRDLGYKCTNVDVCYAMNDVPRQKFDRIRADAEMIINEWKAAAAP